MSDTTTVTGERHQHRNHEICAVHLRRKHRLKSSGPLGTCSSVREEHVKGSLRLQVEQMTERMKHGLLMDGGGHSLTIDWGWRLRRPARYCFFSASLTLTAAQPIRGNDHRLCSRSQCAQDTVTEMIDDRGHATNVVIICSVVLREQASLSLCRRVLVVVSRIGTSFSTHVARSFDQWTLCDLY